jgi:hypothetical protein
MGSTVAITGIAGHTVVVLAAIHYGVKGLALLLPQLRVQAPPKVQQVAAQQSQPDSERPISILGGESKGEAAA